MPWDYTKKNAKKQAEADNLWRLERFINYGSPVAKLTRVELKKNLSKLRVPADRRAFLELVLWRKKTF